MKSGEGKESKACQSESESESGSYIQITKWQNTKQQMTAGKREKEKGRKGGRGGEEGAKAQSEEMDGWVDG